MKCPRLVVALGLAALRPCGLLGQEAGAEPDSCRPLLGLEAAPAGQGLPPDWHRRGVSGAGMPKFEILRADADPVVLRLTSRDEAAFAYVNLEPPLEPEEGSLHWRWRTGTPLPEADLREKGGDDSPVRLFLIFAAEAIEERRLLRDGRALFYTWGNREPVGTSFPSHVSDKLAVWVLRNAADADDLWREEVRDPFADYRAFFSLDPPPIRAIGLLPDTDQTGAASVAEVGEVCWGPGPAQGE